MGDWIEIEIDIDIDIREMEKEDQIELQSKDKSIFMSFVTRGDLLSYPILSCSSTIQKFQVDSFIIHTHFVHTAVNINISHPPCAAPCLTQSK